MTRPNDQTVSILSIDAWGNAEDGFEWNDWHKIGDVPLDVCSRKPDEIITWMIENGFCTEAARTDADVEDDQYNVLICDKNDGNRPLFALAYGEAY